MTPDDRWAAGSAYEAFMGRWSRLVAARFVEWLAPPRGAAWLEVGCGTGALTAAILEHADPGSVLACDPSEAFIAHDRAAFADPRAAFVVGGAQEPPERPGGFDVIVSGLVLNFVAEPAEALAAMRTRLARNGVVAAYVWDYAGRMDFLRLFWEEAVALDPRAAAVDERGRFPLCSHDALRHAFEAGGFGDPCVETLDVRTVFRSIDDYWRPFLGGTGPAPSYVASLDEGARERLRARLAARLAPAGGAIDLVARAWAVRSTK